MMGVSFSFFQKVAIVGAKMRVVITTDAYWPRINGVTVAVDTYRKCLQRLGHTVFVIAPRYPTSLSGMDVPDDHQVFRFPAFSFPWSPEDRMGYPTARWGITRLLEELKPDVVHSHTEFTIGFGGKAYCLRNDVPHVMTCHTYYEKYISTYVPVVPARVAHAVVSSWSRADYRLIDALTVPSRWLAELIRSYGVDCPIYVIPTGIAPEDFSVPVEERADIAARLETKTPPLAGRRVLLYAGRIAREKNIDFLVDAMQLIAARVPEALLLVAGRGPYDAKLKARVQDRDLASNIHFVGNLDRKELAYALSLSETFLFASKTETQGLVMVEAMMCGTPVVAVRSPGTEEVIVGDRGGYLVDEEAGLFAEKVLLLLNDNRHRARKRQEARSVAQEWTAQHMTEKLLVLYENAIKARRDQQEPRPA
jgi:1,2-diacylglycerol 3-alpha-glucosyltransferase